MGSGSFFLENQMSRLLDFNPTDEDIVISRVLVSVHKAIDKKFPNASPAPSRFAKTSFGSDEVTVNEQSPSHSSNETFNETFEDSSVKKLESLASKESDNIIKSVIIAISLICFVALCLYYFLLNG